VFELFQASANALSNDFVDADFGQILTVTVFNTVSFAAFLFENDHFLTFQVFENGCFYRSTCHCRKTYLYCASVINEKDFVKYKCSVHVTFKPMREDFATLFNFKLLTCDFYDCVHVNNYIKLDSNFEVQR